jgi:hypothetical protein
MFECFVFEISASKHEKSPHDTRILFAEQKTRYLPIQAFAALGSDATGLF